MRAAGVDFEAVVYPGTGHAFFNDTNRYTYNAEAAEDSWKRTLAFLERSLSA
ncbi:dienelactone hydrolase family protein [Arthrobacter sp. SAFR-179]|uniref:dienelactone hydrolase family protein n=1 Tax=Arthrobacter sp. SAFR-179 TaxID=3387279 RepID=UPI003F7B9946